MPPSFPRYLLSCLYFALIPLLLFLFPLLSDVSQDLFDLLNIPDSPDQQPLTPEPCEAPPESGPASVPHSPVPFTLPPASKTSFQKDILKLMMDGIKLSLVGRLPPASSSRRFTGG